MAKSFKYKDNNYLDSTGIVHNRELLSNILNNLINKNILVAKCNFTNVNLTTNSTKVIPFNTVTILDNNFISNNSGYCTIKKAGKYKIITATRFGDVNSGTGASVSTGVAINREWLDVLEKNTWSVNNQRCTIRAIYILDLDVGDVISAQGFASYNTTLNGEYYIEYLED